MRKKVKDILSKECVLYIMIAVATIILFSIIYGIRILDPTYVDWLLNGSDLTQHYLGWVGYRSGDWSFPIGMTDRLAYPHNSSVIFTDSIPCFAVLFKILSPVLPVDFQYFGLWGVMCFILQGVLSAWIFRKYIDSKVYVFGVSILLTLIPAVFMRMFNHTALAGQWIILWALEPLLTDREHLKKNWKIFGMWIAIGCVSASVHVYFILMCGIILCGYCLLDFIIQKRILKVILLLIAYLISTAATVGILGGYSSAGSVAVAGGLGDFSMNLNSFLNPIGYSTILKDRYYFPGQYEGFAYLGAGVLFLSLFSTIILLGHNDVIKKQSDYLKQIIIVGTVAMISIMVAISPKITWDDKVLITVKIPAYVTKVWSTFRSSGRVSWVALYIIVIAVCIVIYKLLARKAAVIAIAFCLLIQAYDLSGYLQYLHFTFSNEIIYESPLENEFFWRTVGEIDAIEHIVFTDPIPFYAGYALEEWALSYDKSLSFFPFAHANIGMFEETVQDSLATLPETDLFIFSETSQFKYYEYDLYYYASDGYIIGYCEPLDLPEYEVSMTYLTIPE